MAPGLSLLADHPAPILPAAKGMVQGATTSADPDNISGIDGQGEMLEGCRPCFRPTSGLEVGHNAPSLLDFCGDGASGL
jgi:hypothetical protein